MHGTMFIVVFLLCSFLASANCFCFRDQAHADVSKYGSVTAFCLYKGLKMTVGSHIKTTDCIECSCTKYGLSCCGYGIKGAVYQPQDGCKVVADGCKVLFVKKDDDTKDCVSGENIVKRPMPMPI